MRIAVKPLTDADDELCTLIVLQEDGKEKVKPDENLKLGFQDVNGNDLYDGDTVQDKSDGFYLVESFKNSGDKTKYKEHVSPDAKIARCIAKKEI